MDVAHSGFLAFEDFDHFVQELFDAPAFAGGGRHERDADHRPQGPVVEPPVAAQQFVVHVQSHYHAHVHVDQGGGQVQVAFQVGRIHDVDHHVGGLFGQVPAHEDLLGGIFGQRIGARQVGQADGIALVVDDGRFHIDRNAAVISRFLVRTGSFVEQRSLADVRVAHQRDVDGAQGFVQMVRAFDLAGTILGREDFRLRDGRRACCGGRMFPFAAGRNLDQVGFAAAQGHLVAHDGVFYRVEHRGALDHPDALSAYESHFGDPLAECSVSLYFDDDAPLSSLEIGQTNRLCCFFRIQNACFIPFSGCKVTPIFPRLAGRNPPRSQNNCKIFPGEIPRND